MLFEETGAGTLPWCLLRHCEYYTFCS